MKTQAGRSVLLLVAAVATWQCSRASSSTPPPSPLDTSSALQSAINAKSASFVDDGERGRHAWHEAQRFYKQNGYHYNVYLHDTPAQSLFERVERDFSHGCVRLDEPMRLAQYVLRGQPEWTDEKITAAMQAGTERAVPMRQPLPISLVYFTAWEDDGVLKTVPDVYGIDRRHTAAASGQ